MKNFEKIKNVRQKYLFKLVHLKQMLVGSRFKQIHYSQFGEDIALQKLLPQREGFYVDIGAFHPLHYSNTYLLHKRGWRGINVDPNKESIKLFDKYRPDDTNILAGIDSIENERNYFVYNHQSCNTFSFEQVEKNKNRKFLELIREDKVTCMPLTKLFDNHLPSTTSIDLLSIDVEGMDLQVLKTNDWERYRAKVVVIEIDVETIEKLMIHPTHTYLAELGYVLVSWMGASAIYNRRED